MKIVWCLFGAILLIMCISSFAISMSTTCSHYGYDDYEYYYCRSFRNKMMMKSVIYFIGGFGCFGIGLWRDIV